MTTMLIAAEQETSRGWGGPVALLVAVALFLLIIGGHWWWTEGRHDHSPTEDGGGGVAVNRQVSAVSDTDDTDADTGWWGRVMTLPDGRRVRTTRPDGELVDDDLDLALDGAAETLEDAVARMQDEGRPYMEIVRHLMDEHRVSESTAKRTIRTVRAERSDAA